MNSSSASKKNILTSLQQTTGSLQKNTHTHTQNKNKQTDRQTDTDRHRQTDKEIQRSTRKYKEHTHKVLLGMLLGGLRPPQTPPAIRGGAPAPPRTSPCFF